jgi:hypothetical protein
MQKGYRICGLAAFAFALALASSASQAGPLAQSGASALPAQARTATLVEPVVVVVRRRPLARRGCVWVRGRWVC